MLAPSTIATPAPAAVGVDAGAVHAKRDPATMHMGNNFDEDEHSKWTHSGGSDSPGPTRRAPIEDLPGDPDAVAKYESANEALHKPTQKPHKPT